MNVPWGKINAQKETARYKEYLGDLQRRVNKALELLKMDNPNIEQVIRILEQKE
ncbi:hypothetical protein ACFLWU_02095 [Chloroflexota bacterium]